MAGGLDQVIDKGVPVRWDLQRRGKNRGGQKDRILVPGIVRSSGSVAT